MFKKNIVIGVSITPELGLEVAQIDFTNQVVLKYGVRPLEYNSQSREIADIDIFKETLQDLLLELGIPKGAELVINLPPVEFRVNDYSAAMDETQLTNTIEEELAEIYYFKTSEPCISAVELPNSTMQSRKIAYTAVQKSMLLEIAMIVKDLGYKVKAIDVSVNSVLNALIYKERVNVEPDTNWLLLMVENFACRIFLMSGRNFVDSIEEKVSLASVLGDAENYSTVINAVSPILKNMPSQYLCVISKTNTISAEVLAGKLSYTAPIIHQEANSFSKEAFMEFAPELDSSLAPMVTLDVIGAAIRENFIPYSNAHFNLYNKSLGPIYMSEQPPEITIKDRTIVLSNEFLLKIFAILALIIIIPTFLCLMYFTNVISQSEANKNEIEAQILQIDKFLKDNEDISSELFDEGDEIRVGLGHNKNIYSYYTIVGTEIPKKLWLTHLKLSDKVTVEGQADNLPSIYSFFRSIKDYNPSSDIKLQKLGLAAYSKSDNASGSGTFDVDSLLTTANADFYEFRISNEQEVKKEELSQEDSTKTDNTNKKSLDELPALEPAN